MKVRKIIAAFMVCCLLSMQMSVGVNASIVDTYQKENAAFIEQFLKDYYSVDPDDPSTKEKFEDEYTYNGGARWLCFYDDIESFQNNINKLIKVNYSIFDMESYTAEEIENYKKWFNLIFYTYDYKEYDFFFDITKRSVLTTVEAVKSIGVKSSDIAAVVLHGDAYNAPYSIKDVKVYDCVQGWNEIDSDHYYVKADGTLATKPCVIKGVFYKFDQSGVCKGKYTGFAKVSKGTVYYKNGVRLRNKTLRTKNGTRYKADKNGILTKI
ncbi:MAG: hypothetical protein IJT87_01905 [Ruminiclostridium sp.]|nr:hypothetical protein [Ruminiclostridium sp.]